MHSVDPNCSALPGHIPVSGVHRGLEPPLSETAPWAAASRDFQGVGATGSCLAGDFALPWSHGACPLPKARVAASTDAVFVLHSRFGGLSYWLQKNEVPRQAPARAQARCNPSLAPAFYLLRFFHSRYASIKKRTTATKTLVVAVAEKTRAVYRG